MTQFDQQSVVYLDSLHSISKPTIPCPVFPPNIQPTICTSSFCWSIQSIPNHTVPMLFCMPNKQDEGLFLHRTVPLLCCHRIGSILKTLKDSSCCLFSIWQWHCECRPSDYPLTTYFPAIFQALLTCSSFQIDSLFLQVDIILSN